MCPWLHCFLTHIPHTYIHAHTRAYEQNLVSLLCEYVVRLPFCRSEREKGGGAHSGFPSGVVSSLHFHALAERQRSREDHSGKKTRSLCEYMYSPLNHSANVDAQIGFTQKKTNLIGTFFHGRAMLRANRKETWKELKLK